MTCTADPEYIRAVSVKYKRGPGSTYSNYTRESTVASQAGCEWSPFKIQRPKTAVDVVPSSSPLNSPFRREKTELLDELMFFYGRNVHGSFSFPRHSPQERMQIHSNSASKSLGYPWACQNEALRQLYKASERCPRHRFITCGNLLPPNKATST